MSFAIVGLTGGIGSGKSTVARLFAERGVPIVDADQIAREVVEPGTEGLAEVARAFGEGVLSSDGQLDRAALAERVFGDAEARRRLESILHPRIARASMARFAELAQEGQHPFAVYEAALLVENGSHRMMNALVVVTASEATQVARVHARDELDEDAARARIAAQLPLADKVRVADYVIDNDGSLDETRARTMEVLAALEARFGKGGER